MSAHVEPQSDRIGRIVIATGNPHKVRELRQILASISVEAVGLDELEREGGFVEPDETGKTFEDNAMIKALSYAEQTGLPCLADDSGLEIDALDGRPGVISSHYCTDGREAGMTRDERDEANIERVLREMEGEPEAGRTARFVCVMALATPSPAGSWGGDFQSPPSMSFSGAFTTHAKGDLPHWELGGATFFLTFRLLTGQLDTSERSIVLDACTHYHGRGWLVHRAVVMPDHVHMLCRSTRQDNGSYPTIAGLMKSIKQFAAGRINRQRGTTGALWQREYYDRIMRTPEELEETLRYIEANPVRKGLADTPVDYPWLWRQELGGDWKSPPQGRQVPSAPLLLHLTRGTFEGRIGVPPGVPKGDHGFGYDPIFLVAPEHARTSAELPPSEKHAVSHRGRAARAMADWLCAR